MIGKVQLGLLDVIMKLHYVMQKDVFTLNNISTYPNINKHRMFSACLTRCGKKISQTDLGRNRTYRQASRETFSSAMDGFRRNTACQVKL